MTTSILVERALKENIPVKFEGRNVHPRNSDKALRLRVWELQGLHLNYHQMQKYFLVADTESIRRERQKFQELRQYPADKNVQKERNFKSYRMQQITPKATPKYIDQVLL